MAKTTIFSQIIKLIPRSHFESLVHKHEGDKGIRTLNCWTWFGSLLFSQLTGHDSIRAIERGFCHANGELSKLGFDKVCKSTLSDANAKRPLAILEELFSFCVQSLKENNPKLSHGFSFQGKVLALDSTFIKLCLTLSPWAKYRMKPNRDDISAGFKIHTAIDLAGDIPEFVVIKSGSEKENNDLLVARQSFKFPRGSTLIFDRGYWKASYFNELNSQGIFFVTRLAKRTTFCVHKSHPKNRTQGIICDQEVYFRGRQTKNEYQGKLRRISYREPDTGKKFIFITNRFDLPAQVICDLYKARWRIELFFKCLKQNLKVKRFLGFSEHAVRAQIWTALIAYVLIQNIKLTLGSSISMPDALAVISTLLLLRLPLNVILADLPRTKAHSPPLQLLLNF